MTHRFQNLLSGMELSQRMMWLCHHNLKPQKHQSHNRQNTKKTFTKKEFLH